MNRRTLLKDGITTISSLSLLWFAAPVLAETVTEPESIPRESTVETAPKKYSEKPEEKHKGKKKGKHGKKKKEESDKA